jgi:hypothetical protein
MKLYFNPTSTFIVRSSMVYSVPKGKGAISGSSAALCGHRRRATRGAYPCTAALRAARAHPPEAAAEMRQWEHGVASLSIPWSASRPRTGGGWSACYGIVPARSLRASSGSGRSRPRAGDRDGPCHAAPRMQRLFYQLPKPPPEGQTVLSLTPMEFFERLATLIPPPRRHRHRYHGVLAPNAPLRAVVTSHAGLPMAGSAQGSSRPAPTPAQAATEKSRSPSTYLWAMLLARIYEVFPLRCPRCGEPM